MYTFCRTCLKSQSATLTETFYNLKDPSTTPTTEDKLNICVPELMKCDIASAQICGTCYYELETAYDFKIKCINTYITFAKGKSNDFFCTEDELDANPDDVVAPESVQSKPLVLQPELEPQLHAETLPEDNRGAAFTEDAAASQLNTFLPEVAETQYDVNLIVIKQETPAIEEINALERVDIPCFFTVDPATAIALPCPSLLPENIHRYQCNFCDFKALRKIALREHLTTHSDEKPYKCEVCDYCTAKRSDLVRHIITHTGEKPYPCIYCNYSAARKESLQKHIRIHTGEKPCKCTICDYSATNMSSLRRHTRVHTGEKPYKCKQCEYNTADASSFGRHMKRMHVSKESS